MQRSVTNVIRFIMDELLPPALRDNRLFMYPFFHYWYKGKNVREAMAFKERFPGMSEKAYLEAYQTLDSRATDRPTDMSRACVDEIFKRLDPSAASLLDVGCGRFHLLEQARDRTSLTLFGCDLLATHKGARLPYAQCRIERLPFRDRSVDIVSCTHTLEHLREIRGAVEEIKRVAKRQIVVVVPRQRYYFYSLDFHVHFFPYAYQLTSLFGMRNFRCEEIQGDWLFTAPIG